MAEFHFQRFSFIFLSPHKLGHFFFFVVVLVVAVVVITCCPKRVKVFCWRVLVIFSLQAFISERLLVLDSIQRLPIALIQWRRPMITKVLRKTMLVILTLLLLSVTLLNPNFNSNLIPILLTRKTICISAYACPAISLLIFYLWYLMFYMEIFF